MSTGNRITELRKKLGISQSYLADKVGVSKQSFYKYEKDVVATIPTATLEKIAEVLHTTPAYLMGWDEPTTGSKIAELRHKLGMTQVYLADKADISSQTLYKYEKDIVSNIPADKLKRIAEALNTTPAYLIGWDGESSVDVTLGENTQKVNKKHLPVLSELLCSIPIMDQNSIDVYLASSPLAEPDYCLTVKDDALSNIKINQGDVVLIKEQSVVQNGQIAVVIIDNQIMLRVWYLYPEKRTLVLISQNPSYEPLVFIGEELSEVRCIGRVISSTIGF